MKRHGSSERDIVLTENGQHVLRMHPSITSGKNLVGLAMIGEHIVKYTGEKCGGTFSIWPASAPGYLKLACSRDDFYEEVPKRVRTAGDICFFFPPRKPKPAGASGKRPTTERRK